MVATATGGPYQSCSSLPYGDGLSCFGPTGAMDANAASPLHFTGQHHDEETGLEHFAARNYASTWARWMVPDPLGLALVRSAGKGLLAHQLNPQDWDMYAYALGSPVTLKDPAGTNACSPNDRSTTDCLVYVDLEDRHKNSKGQYDDQFTGEKNQKQYNATATVWVGSVGKNGKVAWTDRGSVLARTTPSNGHYATVADGLYRAHFAHHRGIASYPVIQLNGRIGVVGGVDPLTRRPYATAIQLHHSGTAGNRTLTWDNGTRPLSMGCTQVCYSQWGSFERATGLSAPAPQAAFEVEMNTTANWQVGH